MSRRASFACVALVLVGCEPLYGVRASAHEVCGAEAKPIADARVLFHCNGKKRELGKTDAKGFFEYHAIGDLDLLCNVRLEKEGYVPWEVPVRDLCPAFASGGCAFVFANGELASSSKGGEPR